MRNPLSGIDPGHGSASGATATIAESGERPQKSACVMDELLPDGSMVLYHTCHKEIMTLNPTAALTWECCDGMHSIAMIAEELHAVFPDAGDIVADVLTLLRDLVDRGMVIDENA